MSDFKAKMHQIRLICVKILQILRVITKVEVS